VRDNDGRKLDHKTLEVLRLRAVTQVEKGLIELDRASSMSFYVGGWGLRNQGLGKVRPRPC
jgi:hypothetical protein